MKNNLNIWSHCPPPRIQNICFYTANQMIPFRLERKKTISKRVGTTEYNETQLDSFGNPALKF